MTTVSTILKHVHKGKIESVYSLDDGEYEIIEAKISENSELLNKKILDINFGDDIRIGLIVRDKKVIVPKKEIDFKINDTVILIASRDKLKKLNNYLELVNIINSHEFYRIILFLWVMFSTCFGNIAYKYYFLLFLF